MMRWGIGGILRLCASHSYFVTTVTLAKVRIRVVGTFLSAFICVRHQSTPATTLNNQTGSLLINSKIFTLKKNPNYDLDCHDMYQGTNGLRMSNG